MKIGVVGNGVVGSATARVWLEHCEEVRVYDTVPEKRTHSLAETVGDSDVIFVCLPTPGKADGELDTSAVESFFEWVAQESGGDGEPWRESKIFALRSTMPIGGTRRIADAYGIRSMIYYPEFLTARCSFADAANPSRNLIGIDGEGRPMWVSFYGSIRARFPGVKIFVSSLEAVEAAKLFTNAFFAVKVAFFNEIEEVAGSLGLNWKSIREMMLADGRINPSHTMVPGPDGNRGFGGTCLPKDLRQVVEYIEFRSKSGDSVCAAALGRNEEDRIR